MPHRVEHAERKYRRGLEVPSMIRRLRICRLLKKGLALILQPKRRSDTFDQRSRRLLARLSA